tara:strand:- start:2399 stop:3322 length:924 start_codon:yes stop_codon:yes gene_type:complete
MKLQELKVTEGLIKIPEKVFKTFSDHLEQEALNYMYHYPISRNEYEEEHKNIKGIISKIANKKGITIDQKWTKGKNNTIDANFDVDEFPSRYVPTRQNKEGGIARLQIVYKPIDKEVEGTHQKGIRKGKWLHTIKVIIGGVMVDVLIQDKAKEQSREIKYVLERLKSTLRHELMHLTQEHLLGMTTSKTFQQKTGEWDEDPYKSTGQLATLPGYDKENATGDIHNLSPVEFDPMIDTEAARFRYTFYDRTLPVSEQIKDYIELSDFFKYLKGWRQTKSGKWKLKADEDSRRKTAIRKFATKVEDYLT